MFRNLFLENVAKDMGNMGSFFVRYMMQVAFILNMFYLYDVPHFLVKSFRLWLHRRRYRLLPDKGAGTFKDTWYFDLGYYQAYSLVIVLVSVLFAAVIPLITVFSFVFFALRFAFDKYNQLFVYSKEFEAKGRLKRHITSLLIAVVALSQLLNFALFKALSGVQNVFALGVALVAVEMAAAVGLRLAQHWGKRGLLLERRVAEEPVTPRKLRRLRN